MKYRLQFRRYRLPFKGIVRTAHGPWAERQGIILRLEDESGAHAFAEAAPVPGFGSETVEADAALLLAFGEFVEGSRLADVPSPCGALRHALTAAMAEIERSRRGVDSPVAPP